MNPSLSPEQESLKEQGNEALKSGDALRAVELFTQAINIGNTGTNDAGKAVLFSNRCAAYLTISKFDESLQDAEQSIKLNPSWAKGWARKGASWFGGQKYKEAALAYRKAASLVNGDEAMRYTQLAIQCEANALPTSSSSSSSSSTARSNTTYANSEYKYTYQQPYYTYNPPSLPTSRGIKIATDIAGVLRIMSLLLVISWIITGGEHSMAYPQSMLCIALALATEVAVSNPPISFTQDYLVRVVESPNMVPALVAVSFSAISPSLPAVLAVQVLHLKTTLLFGKSLIYRVSPPIANKVADVVVYSIVVEKILGVPEWRTMDSTAQSNVYDQISKPFVARCEIIVLLLSCLTFLGAILTGQLSIAITNMVGVMLLCNVAKVRYMRDSYAQTTWSHLNLFIRNSIINRVPMLQPMYEGLYSIVCGFARPPGPDSMARGRIPQMGFGNNCVVM
jgi:hypothetical protein